jgi:hypothetical protein
LPNEKAQKLKKKSKMDRFIGRLGNSLAISHLSSLKNRQNEIKKTGF